MKEIKVITAPIYDWAAGPGDPFLVFLAGGITNCEDWQSIVIDYLNKNLPDYIKEEVAILTPRRKDFDITNPNATEEQITWEHDALEVMDLFTMYFADGPSDQPICMYEYGKHCELRSWDLVVATTHPDYKRKEDVLIQTRLAHPDIEVNVGDALTHAEAIVKRLKEIFNER